MNTLWTFGDSYTAEWFPVDMEGINSTYDMYRKYKGGVLPDVWPTILSNKLDMNLSNLGIGGNCNYGILLQFSDVCDNIKEGDILIFGWSKVARYMAANFKEDIFNHILPVDQDYSATYLSKKTIEENFYNRTHHLWTTEVHRWIYMINSFARKMGCKVYHWAIDDLVLSKNDKFTQDDNYILQRNEDYPNVDLIGYFALPIHYRDELIGKIIDETNEKIMDRHLSEYGHKLQAQYFYDFITNDNPTYKKYDFNPKNL
jgi:hypothetical protein